MTAPAQPNLEPGRVYRTRELALFGANPTRLAKRLVEEGNLRQVAHGLFYQPAQSRFGAVPASDEEIMRAFLDGSPFFISGPPRWNELGLGSTAHFAAILVYNTKRTGEFTFDGRRFLLRRVSFPDRPPQEWLVVDLIQHHDMAGVSLTEIEERLCSSLRQGRWDRRQLQEMACQYGTKTTQALIERCIEAAGEAA